MPIVEDVKHMLMDKNLPFLIGYGGLYDIDFYIKDLEGDILIEVKNSKIHIFGKEVSLDELSCELDNI